MNHLKHMKIENFKGFESFDIPEFNQFNFIIGDNNYGKTSLLEAILIISKLDWKANLLYIAMQRNQFHTPMRSVSIYTLIINLFNKNALEFAISYHLTNMSIHFHVQGTVREITLNQEIMKRSKQSFIKNSPYMKFEHGFFGNIKILVDQNKIEYPLEIYETDELNFNNDSVPKLNSIRDNIQMIYISNFDRIMNNSIRRIIQDWSLKQKILPMLNQVFENEFIDLRLIEDEYGSIYETLCTKDTELPLSAYGEGIRQAILLFKGIIQAENGILLIDEIEGGLHRKAVDSLIPKLLTFAKEYNVQIIATTHSEEVVDGVLGTYQEEVNPLLDDINIVRIIKNNNKEKQCIIRKGEEALKLRQDAGMDLG